MDLSQGLNAFLNKVSGLLDIFDLSFFISGAVCSGAVALGMYKAGIPFEVITSTGFKIPMVILGCYVLGLMCFAAGRLIRRIDLFGCDKMEVFLKALKAHQLDQCNPYKSYITNEELNSLYSRMWAQVRENQQMARSLALLGRYWVMTATCDGVAVAMLVWASVTFYYFKSGLSIVFIGFAVISFIEAWRLAKYQVEELVATVVELEQKGRTIAETTDTGQNEIKRERSAG